MKNDVVPKTVTSKAGLARALSVNAKTVSGWIKNGMPVNQDGSYDVETVREWHDRRLVDMVNKSYPVDKIITPKAFQVDRANFYLEDQASDIRIQRIIKQEMLTREKIREMSDQHVIAWFDKLRLDQASKFDQERLERGESTENVAVIVQAIQEAKERRNGR